MLTPPEFKSRWEYPQENRRAEKYSQEAPLHISAKILDRNVS